MEPRIHYAKTEDGVSIWYWRLGEGAMTPLSPYECLRTREKERPCVCGGFWGNGTSR